MGRKGVQFYNRSMKSWLEKNSIKMHSTYNEWKSIIAERFIRALKNKIYKHMISISQNVCIDKLYDIVYHKFKISDIVIISKYKDIFPKGYIPNWSEEVFN